MCRYVAEPCPDYANKEFCDLGEDCPFAHGTFEINLHPSKYCTKVGSLAQSDSLPPKSPPPAPGERLPIHNPTDLVQDLAR
jgi:hypothetical protein